MYENILDFHLTTTEKNFSQQLKEISLLDTFLHDVELNKNIQKVFSSVGETPTKEQSDLLFGLAGITSSQVGLESFGTDIALEAGLLKKLKGLFKQSQTKKLKEFSSGQWSKVQKNYIVFLNDLKREIEKFEADSYTLKKFDKEGVGELPFTKDGLNSKTLEQAFSDYIELRDTAVTFTDFLFSWYEKNVFIKGKQWTSDDIDRLESKFCEETIKKFKFKSRPNWLPLPKVKVQGYQTTVCYYDSLLCTVRVPYLELAYADNRIFGFDYDTETVSGYNKIPKEFTITKSELLNVIKFLITAVNNVQLEPCDFLNRVNELETSVGFSFYYDHDNYIDDDEWEGSIGEKYFNTWDGMIDATRNFTYHSDLLTEWYDYTDIRLIENTTKLIALLVDKN